MSASPETGSTRPPGAAPRVTVIIATYNRSGPLHYAVSSVLAQTFDDFELLVVGDACTDDSETVVLEFSDPRVAWHNLPVNRGNQFAPNNHGLAHARGQYIAYLGHDDLWHRDHLAKLVSAIEIQEGDLAFSLTLDIGPPANPTRQVMGLCPNGVYEWPIWAPPSSWLHRRDVTGRIGNWRDYQSIILPTDADLFARIVEHGMRILPVKELTAFKLTSVTRTNSYLDRTGEEQALWWDRISHDDDLQYRETLAALAAVAGRHKDVVFRLSLPSRISPGSLVDSYRVRRGLDRLPRREHVMAAPLYEDRPALKLLNAEHDIAPHADRTALHEADDMPPDGLFIGLNWHSLEAEYEGPRWRWMDRSAQIVVTRPSGRTRALLINLTPGPGFGGRPAELILRNAVGDSVATAAVETAGSIVLDVPLPAATGAIYTLDTEGGGDTIAGDPRVLNFRVFGLRWAVPDDYK
jgi:glycosyltransferase involved in cell wall biosynthesis